MGVLRLCSCKQRHYTSVPSRETIVQAKQKQRGSSCDCTCCCDQEQVGGTAPNDIVITALPDTITSQSSYSTGPKEGATRFLPFFSQILQNPRDSTPALCEFQKGVCHGQGLSTWHGRAMLDPSAHITTLPCSLLFSISLSHARGSLRWHGYCKKWRQYKRDTRARMQRHASRAEIDRYYMELRKHDVLLHLSAWIPNLTVHARCKQAQWHVLNDYCHVSFLKYPKPDVISVA